MTLPSPRRTALALLTALVCAMALRAPRAARADVFGGTFRSPDWAVEMTVPRSWELSEQRSYPPILAYAVHHRSGGRITLAVQLLAAGETARAYAERNERALRKVGFQVNGTSPHPSGAVVLEATTPDRRQRVRQGYLVHGRVAYVMTLAAPAEAMRTYLRAFDDTLRSITFVGPPADADEAPAPTSDAPAEPPRSP